MSGPGCAKAARAKAITMARMDFIFGQGKGKARPREESKTESKTKDDTWKRTTSTLQPNKTTYYVPLLDRCSLILFFAHNEPRTINRHLPSDPFGRSRPSHDLGPISVDFSINEGPLRIGSVPSRIS